MDTDSITTPYRITTQLTKRREGDDEPYEVIDHLYWHEADGTEVTDPERIRELEEAQAKREHS